MPAAGINPHLYRNSGAFQNDAIDDVAASTAQIVKVYTGLADALTWPGRAELSVATDLTTLALPTAGPQKTGGDDGSLLRVVDTVGAAHTITTPTNGVVPSHKTLTFGGTKGSFVDLQASGGLWWVLASSGVTAS